MKKLIFLLFTIATSLGCSYPEPKNSENVKSILNEMQNMGAGDMKYVGFALNDYETIYAIMKEAGFSVIDVDVLKTAEVRNALGSGAKLSFFQKREGDAGFAATIAGKRVSDGERDIWSIQVMLIKPPSHKEFIETVSYFKNMTQYGIINLLY